MRTKHSLAIALAFASLAAVACGGSSSGPGVPSGDVAIVMNAQNLGANAFSPDPFNQPFATRAHVVWANADVGTGAYGSGGTTHHLVSNTGLFDAGSMPPGSTFAFTFPAAGTYAYHCINHPTMVGTITLTP